MLEAVKINSYYGQMQVLRDVTLNVRRGEAVGLLGRNGAGKTTTLLSLAGVVRPRSGSVILEGKEVLGARPHELARRGLVLAPSGRRVFSDLTVLQNLRLAAKAGVAGGEWTIGGVEEFFPVLRSRRNQRAGTLSGGEQQMLKIGRALLLNPRVLLLDEPSEGLAPIIVEDLLERLLALKEKGLALLVSEQNLGFALKLIDQAFVIAKGEIKIRADALDLANDDDVRSLIAV